MSGRQFQLTHNAMPHTLIAYSSIDGHTLKICERIQTLLRDRAEKVTLMHVDDALEAHCNAFDKIVIGASIRYGKHQPSVYAFVSRNESLLTRIPSAFFSVSAVARKKGKDSPTNNPYFAEFVDQTGWTPRLAATFAGKIAYPQYRMAERWLIRFIMRITGGPTNPVITVDFTNWTAVDAFALKICSLNASTSCGFVSCGPRLR
jgi:menaquinone-dependent protoporphyrinogen oxidase